MNIKIQTMSWFSEQITYGITQKDQLEELSNNEEDVVDREHSRRLDHPQFIVIGGNIGRLSGAE